MKESWAASPWKDRRSPRPKGGTAQAHERARRVPAEPHLSQPASPWALLATRARVTPRRRPERPPHPPQAGTTPQGDGSHRRLQLRLPPPAPSSQPTAPRAPHGPPTRRVTTAPPRPQLFRRLLLVGPRVQSSEHIKAHGQRKPKTDLSRPILHFRARARRGQGRGGGRHRCGVGVRSGDSRVCPGSDFWKAESPAAREGEPLELQNIPWHSSQMKTGDALS